MTNTSPPPRGVEGLLTTAAAAVVAGKHQRTIVAWIRRGLLPALRRPGGRGQYFIEPADLQRVMEHLATPIPYHPEQTDGH